MVLDGTTLQLSELNLTLGEGDLIEAIVTSPCVLQAVACVILLVRADAKSMVQITTLAPLVPPLPKISGSNCDARTNSTPPEKRRLDFLHLSSRYPLIQCRTQQTTKLPYGIGEVCDV